MRVWASLCPVAMSLFLLGWTSAYAQTSAASPRALIFPSETSLVHIDAMALNKAGLPVADMTPADFEVEFDGRKFAPRVAAYISLVEPRLVGTPLFLRGAKPRAEEGQRVIVFFVVNPVLDILDSSEADTLAESLATRSMQAALRTSKLIGHYVDRLVGPRDVVAIARAESRRLVLSEFTTDREVLDLAVEDVRDQWLDGPPINVGPRMLSVFDRRIAEMVDQMTSAVDSIRKLPGRKLMFVSSRFLRSGNEFTQASDALRRFREAANRSAVTIYGMDPTGPTADPGRTREGDKVTPLRELAAATGGRLIANTNNLEGQLERALDENRGYYILGFEGSPDARGRPARIKVRSVRDDVEVRVRDTLAPDLTLRPGPSVREGGTLAELINSPFSPQTLDVGLDVGLRWNESGDPELEVATTVVGATGSPVKLEVLTRILTEQREVVWHEERPMTLRPRDVSRPLRFSTTRKLVAASGDGKSRAVRADEVVQVDVAVLDLASGAAGSVRRILLVIAPQKGQLVLTRPVLRMHRGADMHVATTFAGGAQVLMQAQLAGARTASDGRTRIEIATRFLRNGRLVRAEPPGRIEEQLPNPFNLDGQISLAGLDAGDYEIELQITDLVARKTSSTSSSFSIR